MYKWKTFNGVVKMNKTLTYVIGFPRIGEQRQLKKALENYWNGTISYDSLLEEGKRLRHHHLAIQQKAGITFISCNDFSFYDTMLDTAVMFNAIPQRFTKLHREEVYFAMARGAAGVAALEMRKWFNTNYHYLVPELSVKDSYELNIENIVTYYNEARALGIQPKVNVIGPLTFLSLSKRVDKSGNVLELLPAFLPLYQEFLRKISELDDVVFVQIEEPIVVTGLTQEHQQLLQQIYSQLVSVSSKVRIIFVTYFEHALEAIEALHDIPLWAIGLDFVYGKENIKGVTHLNGKKLIAGVVDGRNIWKNNFLYTRDILRAIQSVIPREDIILSTSCSLLHVPYSLRAETQLASDVKKYLSFAEEKLHELTTLATLMDSNFPNTAEELCGNEELMKKREPAQRDSAEVPIVLREPYSVRWQKQKGVLTILPTTTIGSFPQTAEIRKLRSQYKSGLLSKEAYEEGIRNYIDHCIKVQEDAGLDVLVHGEPERNDMVEFFAENLEGFVVTQNGWVQSYGSRCVKPPIIYSTIKRNKPLTLNTIRYAMQRTTKKVKGIITGPVTIMQWSFVRNDIGKDVVIDQLASVLNEEVKELQNEGIAIIQIDEAAFKEGYPLRREKRKYYEQMVIRAFHKTVSGIQPDIQIHLHMCYSEFDDIIDALKQIDADVITLESSRKIDTVLKALTEHRYTNGIGPGIYDVHSPYVPTIEEFEQRIEQLLKHCNVEQLWMNPDCGLKTRRWEEVEPALKNMVAAVRNVRKKLEYGN